MRFGAYLFGDPRQTAEESKLLERLGFSTIWFGEAPTMGFGDAFQGMADAARATDTARVGTAVTAAGVRPPATTVTQLGTVNSIAPGRITFGIGTGLFTRLLLGLPPLRVAAFRAEIEQLRLLLDGGVAESNGQAVAFREPRGGVRLDPRIEMWIAAGGPKTAAIAGEFGDGLMATSVFDPAELRELRRAAEAAAAAAGKDPAALDFGLEAGSVCVVRDDEDLSSPRVLEIVEPMLSLYFIVCASSGVGPDAVPAVAADSYSRFLAEVEADYGGDPGNLLYELSAVAMRRRPENDRFFPPAVVEACTLAGHHSELRDRIADMEGAGLTDVVILRSRSYRWSEGRDGDDLARLIEAA